MPWLGAGFSVRTRISGLLLRKSECGVSKSVFRSKPRPWETAPILDKRARIDCRPPIRSFTSISVGVLFILRTPQYKTVFRRRGRRRLPNLRVKHHNQSAARTYSLHESSNAEESGRRNPRLIHDRTHNPIDAAVSRREKTISRGAVAVSFGRFLRTFLRRCGGRLEN